jgi:hypothetical protein
MFPVRYILGFYMPEHWILHSHGRENFKSYSEYTWRVEPIRQKEEEEINQCNKQHNRCENLRS